MKEYCKMALQLIRKSVFVREVIIVLFVLVYAFVIFLSSALHIKLKEYEALVPYLKQNGVLIRSMSLSKDSSSGGTLIRDEEELAEYIGETADILCVEKVWATRAKGCHCKSNGQFTGYHHCR